MKKCYGCSLEYDDSEVYCSKCGKTLENDNKKAKQSRSSKKLKKSIKAK